MKLKLCILRFLPLQFREFHSKCINVNMIFTKLSPNYFLYSTCHKQLLKNKNNFKNMKAVLALY